MAKYRLTLISRFFCEEEQTTVIPEVQVTTENGVTEIDYEYEGDSVKVRYDNFAFSMDRKGKFNLTFVITRRDGGVVAFKEGGEEGTIVIVADLYRIRDNGITFTYHYADRDCDKSLEQTGKTKLILKKSEEK